MKRQVRKAMLDKRAAMTECEWRKKSARIRKHILNSRQYRQAERLFVYISMGREVDTKELIRYALRDGKQVCVPVTRKSTGMYFVKITDLTQLRKSAFGVLEPQKDKTEEVFPAYNGLGLGVDLCLIPGAAFDKAGGRYGYGGGYYDRYLAAHPFLYRVALCFNLQVQEERMEMEKFDIPMEWIVTEDGWMGVNQNEYDG